MTTYFNSVPLEWGTAVGCAELLREQCEHPGQQDHGGHHTDRQAVRNLQVRVESVLDQKSCVQDTAIGSRVVSVITIPRNYA